MTNAILAARSQWWAYVNQLQALWRNYPDTNPATPAYTAAIKAANAEYFALGDLLRSMVDIPIKDCTQPEHGMLPGGSTVGGFYAGGALPQGWGISGLIGVDSGSFNFEMRERSQTWDALPSYILGGGISYYWPVQGGFTVAPGIFGLATNLTASPEREEVVPRFPSNVVKGLADLAFADVKLYTPAFTPNGVARAYVAPALGVAGTSVTIRDDTTHYAPFVYGFEAGLNFAPQGSDFSFNVGYLYLQSNEYGADHIKLQASFTTLGFTWRPQSWGLK